MTGEFVSFLAALGAYVVFGGMVFLSVIPFGTEFQHRTFPLLLSQPVDRARIWREKLTLAVSAILSAALLTALMVVLMSLAQGSVVPFVRPFNSPLLGVLLLATPARAHFGRF